MRLKGKKKPKRGKETVKGMRNTWGPFFLLWKNCQMASSVEPFSTLETHASSVHWFFRELPFFGFYLVLFFYLMDSLWGSNKPQNALFFFSFLSFFFFCYCMFSFFFILILFFFCMFSFFLLLSLFFFVFGSEQNYGLTTTTAIIIIIRHYSGDIISLQ